MKNATMLEKISFECKTLLKFCHTYFKIASYSSVRRRFAFVFVLMPFVFCSCVSTKNATYLNTVQETSINVSNFNLEPVVQKNDLLSISISSLNPAASQVFNQPNTESALGITASGYLVDQDGNIQLPILGTLRAEGMTKKQLTQNIKEELIRKKLLLDPIVSIRYLNFKVTVMGEVNGPGVITVPNEKITLLEALGRAGDMTIYARRDNVLVMREDGKTITTKRLNLNTDELLTSPYYYLKNNDVVYVEPNKDKVANSSSSGRWLAPILSGLSFLTIIADRLFR